MRNRIFAKALVLFFLGSGSLAFADSNKEMQYNQAYQDDGSSDFDEENALLWVGPGWYYGIWFTNEEEYDDWKGRNYYHRNYYGNNNRGYWNGKRGSDEMHENRGDEGWQDRDEARHNRAGGSRR